MAILKIANNQHVVISKKATVLQNANAANLLATYTAVLTAQKYQKITAINNWHVGNYKTAQYFYKHRFNT